MAVKKKSKRKKSEKSDSKEKICEVFEVKKGNKETEEKTLCGLLEKKHSSTEEKKNQEKVLRNILIGLAVLILLIIGFIIFFNSLGSFSYRGITGDVVKEGKIMFYMVSFPFDYEGKTIPYNIFIRNDPRKLDKIPFEGDMDFGMIFYDEKYRLVINASDEFDCEGDQVIALANMNNLQALGVKVMKDENATCDEEGRYMYVNIKKGEKTEIRQIGDSCYEIIVKDCDILKATERFMVEMFVKYYE